jgi:hypothetical protein
MHVHQATRAIYYGLHPRGKPGLTLGADTKTRLVSFLTDMGPVQKVLLPDGLELGVLTDGPAGKFEGGDSVIEDQPRVKGLLQGRTFQRRLSYHTNGVWW